MVYAIGNERHGHQSSLIFYFHFGLADPVRRQQGRLLATTNDKPVNHSYVRVASEVKGAIEDAVEFRVLQVGLQVGAKVGLIFQHDPRLRRVAAAQEAQERLATSDVPQADQDGVGGLDLQKG